MILGRNTQQWIGLISAGLALLQVLLVTLVPGIDPIQVAVVLGAVGVFLGVLVAFIANTYTTPVNDPQIEKGTMIRVTDETGRVIDHQKLTLSPPPVAAKPAAIKTHSGSIPPPQ